MRLHLHPDLLLLMAAFAVGSLICFPILHSLSLSPPQAVDQIIGMIIGTIIYLAISPPIYRHLKVTPMWHPKCPSCRNANRAWRSETIGPYWPKVRIRCLKCGAPAEAWFEGSPAEDQPPGTTPV